MDYNQGISYSLNTYEESEFDRVLKLKNLQISDNEEYYNEYDDSEDKLGEIVKVFTKMFPIDPISHFKEPEGFDGRKRVYFNSAQPEIDDFGAENEMMNYTPTIKLDFTPYFNLKNKSIFFGERIIIGDYSKDFKEDEVVRTAKGLTHEVVLLNDGSLVKRGSNVNGQLDFDVLENVKDVVCGRFFTAFLKYDGNVEVFGYCEVTEPAILQTMPRYNELNLNDNYKPLDDENELDIRAEDDQDGRFYFLKIYDDGKYVGEFYNKEEHGGYSTLSAGSFFEEFLASKIKYDYFLVVEREDEYVNKSIEAFSSKTLDWINEGNNYIPVNQWQNIVSIESNYDGLIGVDTEGNKFAFGTII